MTAARPCLYTPIHKSLRRELFHFVEGMAATDLADTSGLEALGFKLSKLVRRLHSHARIEETFMHPLIQAKGLSAQLFHDEHAHHTGEIAALQEQFNQLLAAPTPTAMRAFAGGLNRFVAEYLTHMDDEETGMQALWAVCTDAEIMEVMGRLMASQTVDELLANQEAMLPAVTPTEREGLLTALKQNLAPDMYSHVWTTALRILPEEDKRKLAALLQN